MPRNVSILHSASWREDRERLYLELTRARDEYREVSAQCKRMREEADGMPQPDGCRARLNASRSERVALEKYRRALQAFADHVLAS